METLTGIVSNLRHSTEVYGGGDQGTGTKHVAVFELSGRPVELKLTESIFVSAGDEVIVAGDARRGLLRGMAYRNKTKGVDGKGPWLPYWIVGVVFCAIVVFLPIGVFLIRRGMKYQAAFRAVTAR
jgi:hypothetical protein